MVQRLTAQLEQLWSGTEKSVIRQEAKDMPANKYRRCRGCRTDCLNHYCEDCKQRNLDMLEGSVPTLRESRFSNKVCGRCGQTYTPSGACSHFCELCIREADLEVKRLRSKLLNENGPGSGSNQSGENNPFWKGGISVFGKKKLDSLNGEYFCESCGKDLRSCVKTSTGSKHWAVHHKDRNRNNPDLGNLQLLCKRCHQVIHECWKNFPLKV